MIGGWTRAAPQKNHFVPIPLRWSILAMNIHLYQTASCPFVSEGYNMPKKWCWHAKYSTFSNTNQINLSKKSPRKGINQIIIIIISMFLVHGGVACRSLASASSSSSSPKLRQKTRLLLRELPLADPCGLFRGLPMNFQPPNFHLKPFTKVDASHLDLLWFQLDHIFDQWNTSSLLNPDPSQQKSAKISQEAGWNKSLIPLGPTKSWIMNHLIISSPLLVGVWTVWTNPSEKQY